MTNIESIAVANEEVIVDDCAGPKLDALAGASRDDVSSSSDVRRVPLHIHIPIEDISLCPHNFVIPTVVIEKILFKKKPTNILGVNPLRVPCRVTIVSIENLVSAKTKICA